MRGDHAQQQTASAVDAAHRRWNEGGRRRGRFRLPVGAGVYIHGPVGQGKSLILRTFQNFLEADHKARVLSCHYSDFMLMINALLRSSTLRALEPEQIIAGRAAILQDPGVAVYFAGDEGLDFICAKLRGYTHLLIDEININNISDALLFKRVLERLWRQGLFSLMTSNVPPQRLYEGGLNRSQFVDFITELQERCAVLNLDLRHDFRLDARAVPTQTSRAHTIRPYNVSAPPLSALVPMLAAEFGGADHGGVLRVLHGRTVEAAWVAPAGERALLTFANLCVANRAASDYISLASTLREGLLLTEIPHLNLEVDAEVIRRFIALIDVFYERGIPVTYFAAAPPLTLIRGVADDQLRALRLFNDYLNAHNLTAGRWWFDNMNEGGEPAWCTSLKPIMPAKIAAALWQCKKYETMTLSNLQGLLAYFRLFATSEGLIGELDRDLVGEYGDRLIPPTRGSSTNVAFAVPRLVSRLVEAAGSGEAPSQSM